MDLQIVDVACGQFATAAVTDAGEVYTWGLNDNGQLGKVVPSPTYNKFIQRLQEHLCKSSCVSVRVTS